MDAAATAHRPAIAGTRHMVSAGHYLASHAAFAILEAGGNAIDAGVAAGIALGVLQSDIVNVAGVAPILVRPAGEDRVWSVAGLGGWPRALDPTLFERLHGGAIPAGLLRTVVPAAPAAWIAALARWGTMGFGEVAAAATRFAGEGFAMYPLMAESLANNRASLARWPSTAAIYLPGGMPPRAGERFVQEDLARSLRYMADEERRVAATQGRAAGLRAARDAFYAGDIARMIVRFHEENGGLLRAEDLASFEPEVEPAVATRFRGIDVHACPAWCQGPVLGMMLRLVDGLDLAGMGHNSPAYMHAVAEAMKLAFADREAFFGDPRFVDVPLDMLMSEEYAARRRALIRPDRAWPGMPPSGREGAGTPPGSPGAPPPPRDTSYVCVVDAAGNVFSATPSDVAMDSPVIPGTGLCPSSRGSQNWADPAHPSGVAPGKRPRLTPSPALAIGREGPHAGMVMPFGTPGGDVQLQAMLQVFLNIVVFGMGEQEAVEAPRFATHSFPDSFEPHRYQPGWLNLESRLPRASGEALAALGHDVHWWPDYVWRAGAVCLVRRDPASGFLLGGADPRRPCYAMGW
jgi:gamma-glutamyltranspeptidase/glutathione hydrolase